MNNGYKFVWLIGAGGQLGTALRKLYPDGKALGFNWMPTTRYEVDVSDETQISTFLTTYNPDIIVNAAAYTNVDGAEKEQDIAMQINFRLPELLAKHCQSHHKHLIHISSDYVFGGYEKDSFTEEDKSAPINYYGQTKAMGDEAVLLEAKDVGYILRTSWLYGPKEWGKSFYKSISDKALSSGSLRVVSDEIGTPTASLTLARVIIRIIESIISGVPGIPVGLYNCADEGSVSRYEFARKIVLSDPRTKGTAISPILSDALPPRAARRPQNSTLDCTKLRYYFPELIHPWDDMLAEVMAIDKR